MMLNNMSKFRAKPETVQGTRRSAAGEKKSVQNRTRDKE
jgi:hypothetical protein